MDTDNDKYWRTRVEQAEAKVEVWEEIATKFANACDIDGFNHVRDAHFGDLTQAWTEYTNLKKKVEGTTNG